MENYTKIVSILLSTMKTLKGLKRHVLMSIYPFLILSMNVYLSFPHTNNDGNPSLLDRLKKPYCLSILSRHT